VSTGSSWTYKWSADADQWSHCSFSFKLPPMSKNGFLLSHTLNSKETAIAFEISMKSGFLFEDYSYFYNSASL